MECLEILFDLHAVDGGDGLEDLFEFFEGVDAHGFLEPVEDFGLLGSGREVLWCLRRGLLDGLTCWESMVGYHCELSAMRRGTSGVVCEFRRGGWCLR